MAKTPPLAKTNRKKSGGRERTNDADCGRSTAGKTDRQPRGSGEGSASALANLKTIQRDRNRSRPVDDVRDDLD